MIRVDNNEPYMEALTRLTPVVPCEVGPYNSDGYADYHWYDSAGALVQVERKQWLELLGKLDAVEDQLRRHMKSQSGCRLVLLIEGLIVPTMDGVCQLKPTNKDRVFVLGQSSYVKYSQLQAWLYQVGKYVEVYQTTGYEATCTALAAWFKSDQKLESEHQTFKRHFKEVTFHPNPQTQLVMGTFPGIGEKKAEALVEKFTTLYRIMTATPEELATVAGIGKGLSKTMLQRVGRVDV